METPRPTIAMIGAGSWGTALAFLLAQRGYPVRLWARSPTLADQLAQDRENRKYLPGVRWGPEIMATADLAAALQEVAFVVLAVPSLGVREVCHQMGPLLRPRATVLSVAKGLESETGRRLSEVMRAELPAQIELAVLSGPNLAREVVQAIPTTTVIAAERTDVAEQWQGIFHSPTFRVYTNPDVAGVELAGALKNVIAIGAGINDGLGFGDNTKGALITRGLAEITRLGVKLGARPETFSGLAGIGDLFATCASQHSRNRYVGYEIGRGRRLADVVAAMDMIAEGVHTTKAAYHLAQVHQVDMPITTALYQVLFEDKDPRRAVAELMERQTKCELGGLDEPA